ncbi:MAG: molecular chaperone DnaJ [Candidatus Latescibacteria bacterium]|nr:molecular chaperone DnaJ [Candidatus Latescibacterota bacterium]
MAKRDYYDILGVGRDSDEAAIKSAYRKLALKYHPDRNPDDQTAETRFKEASEAYEVLSDPEKRARYDRFGHQDTQQQFGGGGFQWSDFSHAGEFEDIFGGLFGSMGGGGGRRSSPAGPPRGRDLRIPLDLSLEEIAQGSRKKINLSRLQACSTCSGSGSTTGNHQACGTCRGLGQVQQVGRSPMGQSVRVAPCPACAGQGQIIANPCSACQGKGRQPGKTSLTVTIPPGIDEDQFIRLQGQGDAGPRNGPAGDARVYIRPRPHQHFRRQGSDVLYRLSLSSDQLAEGTQVEVPTLTGRVRLNIPAGTQPGHKLRLRGQGFSRVNGVEKGDQLVEVVG